MYIFSTFQGDRKSEIIQLDFCSIKVLHFIKQLEHKCLMLEIGVMLQVLSYSFQYCQARGPDHVQVNSRKLQGLKKLLVIGLNVCSKLNILEDKF